MIDSNDFPFPHLDVHMFLTNFSSWRHFAFTKEFPYIAFRVLFFLIPYSLPFQLQSHNFEILSFLSRKCEFQIFSCCNSYVHYTAGIQYSQLRFNCLARNLSRKFPQSCPCARLPRSIYVAVRKRRISARSVWNLKITTLAVLLINPLNTNSSELPPCRGQLKSS